MIDIGHCLQFVASQCDQHLISPYNNTSTHVIKYRKIPIISPGLIFVQKAVLLGLFVGELIFGGGYYWKEFCVSKWVGLDNKNSLKHYENSLKQLALTVHGLIFGRAYYWKDFVSEIWGTYFREGLFFGGLIIGILLYVGHENEGNRQQTNYFSQLVP